MPPPSINPLTPDQSAYTIHDSTSLVADFYLTQLQMGAEFTVQCPTTATVKLFQGATSINLSPTANVTDSVTFAGRTVTATAAAGTIDVVIVAPGGPVPAEYWEIQALTPAASTYTVSSAANATIRRVVADPTLQPPAGLSYREHVPGAQLSGGASYVDVVSAAPPAGLPNLPLLTVAWAFTGSVSLPSFMNGQTSTQTHIPPGPDATANGSFDTPGVYASTPLTFQLRATYSTGVAVANDWVVTITPRNHYMILLLDRTGSMASAITGSAQSKWELAVTAAHAWADLLVVFRKGVATQDRAAIMTFQNSGSVWQSAVVGSPDIKIEVPASGVPENLSSFESDINVAVLGLSSPAGSTPIGDALYDALKTFKALPGITTDDRFIIFLTTDGMENSGATVVNPATALTNGAQYFNSASRRNDPSLATVNGSNKNLTIYTLGIGKPGQIDEDVLNALPNTANADGLYRKVDTAQEVVSAFGDFLGDSLGAKSRVYTVAAGVGTFPLDPHASRLALVVRVDIGVEIQLAWQQGGGAFTTIAGQGIGALTGVTYHHRNGHCIAAVDFATGGFGLPFDSTQSSTWRIQLMTMPNPTAPNPGDVLALVDLFIDYDITFDQAEYRTGQPMLINCRISAGNAPVTGATVAARVQRPGEGLGTFLSINGPRYTPRPFIPISRAGAPASAEIFAPKSTMLQTLLAERSMTQLPETVLTTGIFADGTSRLIDDGAHGDGAAGDGNYANTFADTTKEGTYTFIFEISVTLPDGTIFPSTFKQSKWVGVEVAPWNSAVTVSTATTLPGDNLSRQIVVMPKDARGEFLGPFRTNEVAFHTTAGSFQGDLVDLPNGSYTRTLVYATNQNPIVTITVQGKPLEPALVEPGHGCLAAPVLWLIALLKWIIAKLKKLIGIP
jgi:hypothetical protein